ncbi:MAG TPA: pantetheine-phosphate adenylyltransferase [Rectinemataceae bacterium]|nr:pantetheine-phosphate adenylyltransferase [Rectinemataceae bacterium]
MKAVFAGTFDPPTSGHLDIIVRAAPMFSELRIVVARNFQKQPLFTLDERIDMLRRLAEGANLANAIVDSFDGLISEYARKNHCGVLLRSIRNMSEVPYEQTMATFNRRLEDNLETLFLFAHPEFVDVSSSAVRELLVWKRLPRGIVPNLVQKELEKRFGPLLQD